MPGQQPQPCLVLSVGVEIGIGDDVLGQAGLFQVRPKGVPCAGRGQLGAQEERDHLCFAAWPQPPHTQHLAPVPVAV